MPDPALAPDRCDPARTRALLKEAGYPDGFGLTIHSSSDRYPGDAQVAQAVAADGTSGVREARIICGPYGCFRRPYGYYGYRRPFFGGYGYHRHFGYGPYGYGYHRHFGYGPRYGFY